MPKGRHTIVTALKGIWQLRKKLALPVSGGISAIVGGVTFALPIFLADMVFLIRFKAMGLGRCKILLPRLGLQTIAVADGRGVFEKI